MMDQFSILEVFKALLGKAVTDLIYIAKVLLQAKDWRRGLTKLPSSQCFHEFKIQGALCWTFCRTGSRKLQAEFPSLTSKFLPELGFTF